MIRRPPRSTQSSRRQRQMCIRDRNKSGFDFFLRDGNHLLRGDGLVRLVDDVFTAEGLIGGAVEFCLAADGIEKVFEVRLMDLFVEGYRDVVLQQRRSLP